MYLESLSISLILVGVATQQATAVITTVFDLKSKQEKERKKEKLNYDENN